MGVTTDGQISYGIMLTEEVELPWDTDEFEYEIEDWWLKQTGFKLKYEDDPDTYFTEVKAWLDIHPIPVEPVNYCSGDYPMYILAVPNSVKTYSRGYPLMFDPTALERISPEEHRSIIEFCKKYEIETDGEHPGWYLSSYWG